MLRAQGLALPPTIRVTPETDPKEHPGALVIAPPSALGSPWMRRFGPASTGFASGWMALRGVRRRRAADRGFVLSDHADWDGLNAAIAATGADRVFVTHGYTADLPPLAGGTGLRRRRGGNRIRGRNAGLRDRRTRSRRMTARPTAAAEPHRPKPKPQDPRPDPAPIPRPGPPGEPTPPKPRRAG